MKFLRAAFCFVCMAILCCGCSADEVLPPPAETAGLYLSITATESVEVDGQEELWMSVFCYDITECRLQLVQKLPYHSQYPLTAYDRSGQAIYFSDRDENGRDQLAVFDMTTGETTQLSTHIFAINYIVPMPDAVFFIAAPRGVRQLRPLSYIKSSKTFSSFDVPEDLNCMMMSYQPETGTIITSGYLEADMMEAMEEQMEHAFVPPDEYIYLLQKDAPPTFLYKTKRESIESLALFGNKAYFVSADNLPMRHPNMQAFAQDLASKEVRPLAEVPTWLPGGTAFFCGDNDIFYLGLEGETRGIYLYHQDSGEKELIFSSETGWINNFMLLSGTAPETSSRSETKSPGDGR
ncbi:MAG: hypothetical protein LBJ11_09705 [Oscillospiraceae bacterium]|nr:hypothetical protein [Oscillospiraceae bacterium]